MKDTKYILLILNCKRYRYKAEIQKKTWLENIPKEIKYFHVIGDKNICKDKNFIIDEENNNLFINVEDDYNHLPKKIINAIKIIKENFNCEYIFKTDDDQKLIDDNFFLNLIDNITKNNYDYGGRILSVNNHYSKYNSIHPCLPNNLFLEKTIYCTGRFYFLSNNAAKSILKNINEIEKRFIEDHAIGYYLENKYKQKIFNINTDKIFKG